MYLVSDQPLENGKLMQYQHFRLHNGELARPETTFGATGYAARYLWCGR
jgi:hypothetical protein